MAKPAYTRAVFSGVIGTSVAPVEHWSFGVNFPADALPADGSDIVADGVALDLNDAWHDSWRPRMGTDVVLTNVKVSHVLATGHVATRGDGSYVQGESVVEWTGVGAPQAMPLQTALCVSLTTARPGPTGKGRFFLPWPAFAVSAITKSLSVDDAGTIAADAVAFLNHCATIMTFAPQVVSSKGYMSEVTGVRVGRVPDTMRSRREDLPEGYVSLPLA
jgi:hypothetical protein